MTEIYSQEAMTQVDGQIAQSVSDGQTVQSVSDGQSASDGQAAQSDPNVLGILVGRFCPPHSGHFCLIRDALDKCDRLCIVIGSPLLFRTLANLFFAYERELMIRRELTEEEQQKIVFMYLPDYNNMKIWQKALENKIKKDLPFDSFSKIKLFGYNKDSSSSYLCDLSTKYQDETVSLSFANGASSTNIRKALLDGVYVYDEARKKDTIDLGELDNVTVDISTMISCGCTERVAVWLKHHIEEEKLFGKMYIS